MSEGEQGDAVVRQPLLASDHNHSPSQHHHANNHSPHHVHHLPHHQTGGIGLRKFSGDGSSDEIERNTPQSTTHTNHTRPSSRSTGCCSYFYRPPSCRHFLLLVCWCVIILFLLAVILVGWNQHFDTVTQWIRRKTNGKSSQSDSCSSSSPSSSLSSFSSSSSSPSSSSSADDSSQWFHEYRLCASSYTPSFAADPPSLHLPVNTPLYPDDGLRSDNHNTFLEPGWCTSLADVPSAHKIGRATYPESILKLEEGEARNILEDEGVTEEDGEMHEAYALTPEDITFLFSSYPAPWLFSFQIRAVRFDPRLGDFHLLVWVEELLKNFHPKNPEGPITSFSILDIRKRMTARIFDYLFKGERMEKRKRKKAAKAKAKAATGEQQQHSNTHDDTPSLSLATFTCDFPSSLIGDSSSSSFFSVPVERVKAGASKSHYMASFRLRCAWPLHPVRPPLEAFQFLLKLQQAPGSTQYYEEYRLKHLTLPSTAAVNICTYRERRVAFAYCSAPLFNNRYAATVKQFVHHHALLGVQSFHIYDRYSQQVYRDVLKEEIRTGIVQIHWVPESVYYYYNGQPAPFGRYLDQHVHVEVCHFNHHESAQYILSVDMDEFLFFPHPLLQQIDAKDKHDTEAPREGVEVEGQDKVDPPPNPAASASWMIPPFVANCLGRSEKGSPIVLSSPADPSSSSPSPAPLPAFPPYLYLSPAVASQSPLTPALYSALTHLPIGCRSMMGDMLVSMAQVTEWDSIQVVRAEAAEGEDRGQSEAASSTESSATGGSDNPAPSRSSSSPPLLSTPFSTPSPYPFPSTSLPLHTSFSLPFSFVFETEPQGIIEEKCLEKVRKTKWAGGAQGDAEERKEKEEKEKQQVATEAASTTSTSSSSSSSTSSSSSSSSTSSFLRSVWYWFSPASALADADQCEVPLSAVCPLLHLYPAAIDPRPPPPPPPPSVAADGSSVPPPSPPPVVQYGTPKNMYRARASIGVEVHLVAYPPAEHTDPTPIFLHRAPPQSVRLLHFTELHKDKREKKEEEKKEKEENEEKEGMKVLPREMAETMQQFRFHDVMMHQMESMPVCALDGE